MLTWTTAYDSNRETLRTAYLEGYVIFHIEHKDIRVIRSIGRHLYTAKLNVPGDFECKAKATTLRDLLQKLGIASQPQNLFS